MKTKAQKQEELKQGAELYGKSKVVILTDFSKVSAEGMRKLRRELKAVGAQLLVMKKRLLGVLFKEKGIEFDSKKFQSSVGAVFSSAELESISAPIFKFFSELGGTDAKEKALWLERILGGYELKGKSFFEGKQVVFIGQLPSREVLLGQLVGMLNSPIRSLLFVLDQHRRNVGAPTGASEKST